MNEKGRKFVALDDNESMYFARELEFVKSKTYDIVFPQLKAMQLIPVSTEAGPGAQSIVYQQYEDEGIAKIISSYAHDLPRADVKGKEFSAIVKAIGNSYGWNIQEIRAAQRTGKPLQARKATAARRAFDTLVDSIAWFGDQPNNLGGLITNPNITSLLAATGAGGKTTWLDKTPDEILTDLKALIMAIIDLTNEVEAPDTLILPVSQYGHIAMTPRSSNADTTILEYFVANNPYIKNVVPCNKLKSISPAIVGGGNSTNIAIAYPEDPDVLTLEIPDPFEQLPVQERGLEFVVNCYGTTGGVIIYRPLAIAIMEGI